MGGPSTVLITAGSSNSFLGLGLSLRILVLYVGPAGAWSWIPDCTRLGGEGTLGEGGGEGGGAWGWLPSTNRRSTGSASRSSALRSEKGYKEAEVKSSLVRFPNFVPV